MAGTSRSADLQSALEQKCERITKPKSTVLFRRGEKASGMFVLFSGKVTLEFGLDAPNRSCAPVALLGLSSGITGHNYSMTATVTEDAELGFLDVQTLKALLLGRSELIQRLLTMLAEKKAERYELRQQPGQSPVNVQCVCPSVIEDRWSFERRCKEVSMPQSKRLRLTLLFALTGAISFWVPDIAVHAHAGPALDSRHVWALTLLSPLTFLFAYLVARRFAAKLQFRWTGAAMLSGVWLGGGVFMTLAAVISGSGLIGGTTVGQIIVIAFSVIPIVTFIMATADTSSLALLGVTIGALLVCGVRASCMLLRSPQGSAASWSTRPVRDHQQS
jgi:hypothetical protein